jgi:hypothetical protein
MPHLFRTKSHDEYFETTHDDLPRFSKLVAQEFVKGKLPNLGSGEGVKVCVVGSGGVEHPCVKHVAATVNVGGASHSQDRYGHAHAVAGIIGANDHNQLVGLAPDCELLFAKADTDEGEAKASAIAAGILWGAVMQANVIVVPYVITTLTEVLSLAVEKAVSTGSHVIVEGTGEGALVPEGAISSEGLVLPVGPLFTTAPESSFCAVSAADFTPAILGGVIALLVEKTKLANKKIKPSSFRKHLTELLKG